MKIWVAVLAGILLGSLSNSLLHPSTKVRAANGSVRVHAFEIGKGDHFDVVGSQVVGFSCTSGINYANTSNIRCIVLSAE
jgi:hypothetical protein